MTFNRAVRTTRSPEFSVVTPKARELCERWNGVRVPHPRIPGLAVTIQIASSIDEPSSRQRCLVMFIEDSTASVVESVSAAQRSLQQLTPSERRVALLVAEGLRNSEIAIRLRRSRRTVEYQLSAIFRKLEMTCRTQLVRVLVAE